MAERITTKRFAKNVVYSLVAQIISLAVSFVVTLIVPRYIGEYAYSYWQSYVLYVGYVGVLHFGLLDGLVLRYSKYDYDELDKPRLRSQFITLMVFMSALSLIGCAVSLFALGGQNKIIFLFVAIGILIKNVDTYNSYMLQITNRINRYVIVTIVNRLTYGTVIAALLISRSLGSVEAGEFYWYCLADILAVCVSIVISHFFNKGLHFGKSIGLKATLAEVKQNVSAGIVLMIANWSATLLIGSAKMMAQWRWGDLVFGEVAFAFSVSNVFLVFITAISVVLFPSLKRLDESKLPNLYKSIRRALSPLLFAMLALYFVGCAVVERWLPNYSSSLLYLGIFLPMVVFSSKVSLLTNNYLKVYRKEKTMMIINLCSIALGVGMFALCAYAFNNLIALMACVVVAVMFNSIASEICVMRTIGIKIVADFIIEAFMTVAFILSATLLHRWIGFAVYMSALLVYFVIYRKQIISGCRRIANRLHRHPASQAAPAPAEAGIGSIDGAGSSEADKALTADTATAQNTQGAVTENSVESTATDESAIQSNAEETEETEKIEKSAALTEADAEDNAAEDNGGETAPFGADRQELQTDSQDSSKSHRNKSRRNKK